MSAAVRVAGPVGDLALPAGVRTLLATPVVSVIDRAGSVLIIGVVEMDPNGNFTTEADAGISINGVDIGVRFGRHASRPLATQTVSVTIFFVHDGLSVGDTIQLNVLASAASMAQAGRSSLAVISLPFLSGEVAGLVSP